MKKRRLKIAAFFEFPPEVTAGGMSLNLYENIGCSVENYREVLTCTDELLRLVSAQGVLRIEGERLCIADMDSDTLMVKGCIRAIRYENDERI